MPRNVSYKVAARACMNNCTLSGYLWLCKHGLCDFMWVIVEVGDAGGSFTCSSYPSNIKLLDASVFKFSTLEVGACLQR